MYQNGGLPGMGVQLTQTIIDPMWDGGSPTTRSPLTVKRSVSVDSRAGQHHVPGDREVKLAVLGNRGVGKSGEYVFTLVMKSKGGGLWFDIKCVRHVHQLLHLIPLVIYSSIILFS